MAAAVLGALLVAATAREAGAQTVNGRITDASTEAPVSGATLKLVDDAGDVVRTATSDSRGWFTLRAPAPGMYRIHASRIGYREGISQPVDLVASGTVAVELRIATDAVELEPVTVRGRPRSDRLSERGFYERREMFGPDGLKSGYFLEEEDIARGNPFRITDIFQSRIPGVRVTGDGGVVMRLGCQPAIFVNGFKRGLEDVATPRSLAGVEVYTGLAIPANYLLDANGCGVILLWTR
jgi:hypothetical protein